MDLKESKNWLEQMKAELERSRSQLQNHDVPLGVSSSTTKKPATKTTEPKLQIPVELFSKKILFYYRHLSNTNETLAGTSAATVSIATALAKANNTLSIHVTGDLIKYPENYQGVEFHTLPAPEQRNDFLANYDIVIFSTYLESFVNCTKSPNQIWILHVHNWQLYVDEVANWQKFDTILCLSAVHRDAIVNQGVSVEKIKIVPNFVDTTFFQPKSVMSRSHSIMFAGAVVDHKCVHVLLESIPEVRKTFPDTEVHIYGSFTLWKDRTDEYENRLKQMGLSGVYFHGAIPNSKMPEFYPLHSVLCLPSQEESFGLVTVEAQACGCIPIVHNSGGVSATLVDGQTGFLYSPNNAETLAHTIVKAFNIIDRDPSIRDRAVSFVRDNLSLAKVMQLLVDKISESVRVENIKSFRDKTFFQESEKEKKLVGELSLDFKSCFTQIREPKIEGWIPPTNSELMSRELNNLGVEVYDYDIVIEDYRQYFEKAGYLQEFSTYYSWNQVEKSLEHYLAATFLQLNDRDVYIDVASQASPVPTIYNRLFGCKTYQQDLDYPPGLNGNTIGGDAAHMPIPDQFASKMALHCSFEHFEGDSDMGFVREVSRILKPGGAVCICPLYLFQEYAIQTDPVTAISTGGVQFEEDAIVYCSSGWQNRHGRFYDPQHVISRIANNLNGLKLKIYRIKNGKEVDQSCYIQFAAVLEKPLDDNTLGLDQETAKRSLSHKSSSTHPTKTTQGKPNQFSSISSHPRIDVVLPATGLHGWNFSRGWVNVLQRQGLLNRVFTPVAEWGASEPTDDDGLYEYLKNPQADIMLLLGFDWHSQPLHSTRKWQNQWHQARVKKVVTIPDSYLNDAVQNTSTWREQMSMAIKSTVPCVDAIICHHEPDVTFLYEQEKISKPIKFYPFAIDTQYFQRKMPFRERVNRAFFRGQVTNYHENNPYKDRSRLIQYLLSQSQLVDAYQLDMNSLLDPVDAVQYYAKSLNQYRLLLSLPSLSPTLVSRTFESLGCGGLLLQSQVIGEESNKLFRDWEHLVYYDSQNPEDLIKKIEYFVKNPDVAEKIADRGYQLCQEKHTIECRVKELIEWADSGFRVSEDTPKTSEATRTIILKSQLLNRTINLHRQSKNSLLVAVDGVFFQLNNTGIARVWKSLLEEWVKDGFAKDILVLDRAGTAPKISGIKYRNIPAYDYAQTEADRQMLQQICDEVGAGIFISTYYTNPLSTPSVFMGYDMIPELIGQNLHHPMWREKHSGIRHASAYITISENTAYNLVGCFPELIQKSITVAHCGVSQTLSPASSQEIYIFMEKYSICKPYFFLVGERSGWCGYKNGILFFKAFAKLPNTTNFEIVCTGGAPAIEEEFLHYTSGVKVHKLHLTDEELKIAYSGAVALVYPSLYEGFGMPVLEAMACRCPVIASKCASIPEVAGTAALYISGFDVTELVNALQEIQKPELRNQLIAAGLEQAKKFSWSKMAEIVKSVLMDNASLHKKDQSDQPPQPFQAFHPLQTPQYKVSAIISTYNSEKFIRGRLDNLVNQTLYTQGQLEIIVIDSNSEQNEYSIVKDFQNKYPHIIYERTPNRETIYAAWNRGIRMCHGQYVINANADDRFATNALEIMANKLDNDSHLSAVYGDWLITALENDSFDSNSEKFDFSYPEFIPPLLLYYQITTHAPLIKRSVFDQIGYYRDDMKVFGDREFMLRFYANGFMAAKIPDIVGLYYENLNSVSMGEVGQIAVENEYNPLRDHYLQPENLCRLFGYNSVVDNSHLAQLYAVLGAWGKDCYIWKTHIVSDLAFAEEVFCKALELAPTNSLALNNLGIIKATKGNYQQAREMFNLALQHSKSDGQNIQDNIVAVDNQCNSFADYFWVKPSMPMFRPTNQLTNSSTSEQPLVSVIIPTKDRPEMLTQAIQSVLNQTFTELEIIVINDGGVDVQSVISRLNTRGNIIYKKHDRALERSAARNTGIRAARGKYIAYLDDDDNYYPNHIETLVKFLENSEYKIAYTDAVMAEQKKQNGEYVTINRSVPYSLDFDKDKILVSNCTPNLCLMHEKSCLDEVGLFDETLSTHEDWDLIIRLSRKFDIAHIKETTCEFTQRNDGTNTSSHNRADFTRTREIIFNRYQPYAEANPAILEAQKEAFVAEAKELAQQVQNLQSQVVQQESQLQLTQAEKSQLSAQVETWQRTTQEVQAKLEATQSEKEWVKSQLNTWKQTAQEMQIELERSRLKLKQTQSELEQSAFPIGKS